MDRSRRLTRERFFALCCSEARKNKRVMRVPKGTSDYQATWIIDEGENGEADEESSDEDDDDDDMLDEAMEGEDEDDMSQVNTSVRRFARCCCWRL